MNKPTLSAVEKLFKDAGWCVEIDYDSDLIGFSAEKTFDQPTYSNEFLKAEFAYRSEDMQYADEENFDEIKEYSRVFGDRAYYYGTPVAIEIFEKEQNRKIR